MLEPSSGQRDISELPLIALGHMFSLAYFAFGTLYTWTIQRFPPPPPYVGDVENFVPFAVGYIELPEGVRVEARLLGADAESLAIGMEMELAVEPFSVDGDGREVVTFAFTPVAA